MQSVNKRLRYLVAIKGEEDLDWFAESLYRSIGIEVKVGVEHPFNCLFGIFNETLLIFHYRPAMHKAISEMFKRAKNIKDIAQTNYHFLYDKPLGHSVILINDKEVAKRYKDYLLNFF